MNLFIYLTLQQQQQQESFIVDQIAFSAICLVPQLKIDDDDEENMFIFKLA